MHVLMLDLGIKLPGFYLQLEDMTLEPRRCKAASRRLDKLGVTEGNPSINITLSPPLWVGGWEEPASTPFRTRFHGKHNTNRFR